MDEKSKQIEIRKVPMRRLMASIKQDMRQTMKASAAPRKPLKPK